MFQMDRCHLSGYLGWDQWLQWFTNNKGFCLDMSFLHQYKSSVGLLFSVPQDRLGDSGCLGDISVAHSIPGRTPSLPQEPASPLLPSHGQTISSAAGSQNGVSVYRDSPSPGPGLWIKSLINREHGK